MKKLIVFCSAFLAFGLVNAQEKTDEALAKAKQNSIDYTFDANSELKGNKFTDAEANYRKAISDYGENATAKYNLGNAYYSNETYDEALLRYKQAAEVAETKAEKHKAFHNLGNVYMQEKQYQQAVNAYKDALRNNPKDDETRYNYALAKKMLEKQQQDNKDDKKDDQQNKDQNKDNKDNQDNQQNKDQQKKDQNKGDDKDDQNKQDQGNQKDQNKDQNKDQQDQGDGKKDQQKKPDQQNQNGQPQNPSKASPEQIKRMLKAIEQEDKNVQDKQNAKKVQGVPVKTEKDW